MGMPKPPRQTTWRPRPNAAREIAERLPPDADAMLLRELLCAWLAEIRAAVPSQMAAVYRSVEIVRKQRSAVSSLTCLLDELPESAFVERLLVISVLGELRREDAVEFLLQFARRQLPAEVPARGDQLMSPRTREEALQAKAIEGVAYFRTEAALLEARKTAASHESLIVRLAALDAFLWNRGDTGEAGEVLLRELPPNMHAHIGRKRFAPAAQAQASPANAAADSGEGQP